MIQSLSRILLSNIYYFFKTVFDKSQVRVWPNTCSTHSCITILYMLMVWPKLNKARACFFFLSPFWYFKFSLLHWKIASVVSTSNTSYTLSNPSTSCKNVYFKVIFTVVLFIKLVAWTMLTCRLTKLSKTTANLTFCPTLYPWYARKLSKSARNLFLET